MNYQVFYPILDKFGAPVLVLLFILLLILQYKWPLRRWIQRLNRRFLPDGTQPDRQDEGDRAHLER